MQYGIDLILLIIFLAAIGVSAKKGIVRTVLDVVAFVLALVLAAQFSTPLAKGCYDALLSERVETTLEQKLEENQNATASKTAALVIDSLPGFAKDFLENSESDISSITKQMASGSYTPANAAADLNAQIARPACIGVLTSVFFLLLFAVLSALLQRLARLLAKAFKLPIVGTINAVFGGVFGAVKGAVLVFVVSAILLLLAPRIGGTFAQAVDASQIVRLIESYIPSTIS